MHGFASSASLAILIGLSAGVADAAITADQLWARWQSSAADAGMGLAAEATERAGSVLRLSGVTLTLDTGARPAGAIAATVGEVVMREGSDGTVTVVPSGDIRVGGADRAAAGLVLSHEAGQMLVSEAMGAMTHDVTGTRLKAAYGQSEDSVGQAADGTIPKALTDVALTMAAPVIRVTETPGLNRTFAVDLTAGSLDYAMSTRDAGLGILSAESGRTENVAIRGQFLAPSTVALASLTTPEAWSAALKEGMALRLSTTQGASATPSKDESAAMPFEMTIASAPGTAEMSVGAAGFALVSQGGGLQVSATSPMLPFARLDMGVGPMVVKMAMPILSADKAGDYGLTLKLSDVTVNEEAWAVLDPKRIVSRDPAQVVVETRGTMKVDMLALMSAEQGGMTEVVPPQPLTLDIPQVMVSAAGALLTGAGSFSFDNASGEPVPAGTADVTLSGGNKLIDSLVVLGLLTEEDAGRARMMMAMFLNVAGDDVLTSRIEAKADGSISVNGQRVQ